MLNTRNIQRQSVFAGVIALMFTAALFILEMSQFSFWVDEVRLIRAAQNFDLTSIYDPDFLDSSIHPPVLYIVLSLWLTLIGGGDFELATMPVFFGIVAAAWLYRATVDLTQRPVAGVAAVLVFASLGFARYYVHQVHNYGILLMLAAGIIALYVRWLREKRFSYAVGIVTFAVVLLYTHYYSVVILGALSLHALMHAPHRWIRLMLISGLLYLPWLPALFQIQQGMHFDGGVDGGITNYLPSTLDSVILIVRSLFYERPEFYLVVLAGGLLFVRQRRLYGYLLGFIVVSFLLALGFNEIVSTLYDRRMIFILVIFALAYGVLFASLPRQAGYALTLVVLMVSLSAPRPSYLHGNWAFRFTMENLSEYVEPNDLVFIQVTEYWHSPYHLPLDYYAENILPDDVEHVMQGSQNVHTWEFANDVFAPLIADRSRFWVVRLRDNVPVPEINTVDWVYYIEENSISERLEVEYGLFRMTLFKLEG